MSKHKFRNSPEEEADIFESEQVEESQKPVVGMVTGCAKLNVRKLPDALADVICAIYRNTEVMIDMSQSTDKFYKIITVSGVEGYCMRDYITIK